MNRFCKIALCVVAALAFGPCDDLLAKTKSKKPAPQTSRTAAPLSMPFGHGAPGNLYPDHALTPGAADTYSVRAIQARYKCPPGGKAGPDGKCTYSAAHRSVSTPTKNAVYAAYDRIYP